MNNIQNLLTQISTLVKKNNEILDASGSRFNMFKVLGVDHYENIHSSIFCEFLNPKGSHGLKDQFLVAFINQILKTDNDFKDFVLLFKTESSIAMTEYPTQHGRIDILIEDNKGHAIIIENKIYASDQWEQLKRYNQFAIDKYHEGNYQIFYLTLYGTEASENSGEGVSYLPISHSEFIIEWLDECVHLATRYPLVRETLIQYSNHLKKLTNQDMSTQNSKEVVNVLLSSEENILAAFSIAHNIAKMKEEIIQSYFNPQMRELAEKLGLKYSKELEGNHIYSGFSFEHPNWKYFKIYFEFDGVNYRKLGYMFFHHNKALKPENSVKILYNKFTRHNQNTNIPCGWSYMNRFQDWNEEAFLSIVSKEKELYHEIERVVTSLLEMAKGFEM